MKSNPAFALLADDLSPSGAGSIAGLLLFVVALIAVAVVMAVSAKKLAWQSAALTWFLWLSVGLLMQPWTLFTHQSQVIPVDDYWAPCWKIAVIVWAVSLLLCFVLLIAIYRGKKNSHRRRRRSSRGSSRSEDGSRREGDSRRKESGSRRESGGSQSQKPDDDDYEEYEDDSYEV